MSTFLTLVAATLLWPGFASQSASDTARIPLDSERAMRVVLENRDKFLPYGFAAQSEQRPFNELDLSVKMLGEAQTADGPRKLAVVQVRARAADGQYPREMLGLWVAYFTPEMKYVEHHNQGCGNDLRLEGSVIRLGERRFNLATHEGLAGFRATQNWC